MEAFLLRALAAVALVSLVAWAARTALGVVSAWLRIRRLANRFPGIPAWPLVGNLLQGGRWHTPYTFLSMAINLLGENPAVQMWLGPFRIIFLSDPDDIQIFLSNPKHEKSHIFKAFETTFGKGLLLLSGDDWRRHHKIISPAFSVGVLDWFVPVFSRQSDIFVQRLRDYADRNVPVDMEPMINALTFDCLCETVMGVEMNTQTRGDSDYFRAMKVKAMASGERLFHPWLLSDLCFRFSSFGRKYFPCLKEMTRRRDEVIRERKEILENTRDDIVDGESEWGRKCRLPFLDALLIQKALGKHITDEEIGDEVDTFMMAGHDALVSFYQMALTSLAENPDVQKKVVDELRSVFEAKGRFEMTSDVLKELTYLEMVVKEVLRLRPPVWTSSIRRANEDVRLPSCGLVVPSGANVVVAYKAAHRKAQYFPAPEVFDPLRFAPEAAAKGHRSAFVPFGGGQHLCIGRRFGLMQAKVVLAKTLWHYEIGCEPSFSVRWDWSVSTKSSNGLTLRLLRRTD